jgi:hypothetical protein
MNFKGGFVNHGAGYKMSLIPKEKRIGKSRYKMHHVLLAEKALGRPLPFGAKVHHLNGSKDCGPIVVCENQSYHMLLHRREKALRECGHANWRKCVYCKNYDDTASLFVAPPDKDNYQMPYHRSCKRYFQKQTRLINQLKNNHG